MTLSVQIEDQQVQALLQRLQSRVRNRRPAHREITRRLVTRIQNCFMRSTDPWGSGWEALRSRDGQPLRDTGRLFNSIPAASTSDNDSSTAGTNVKYGITHQYGAEIKAQPGNPGQNVVGPRKGSPFLRFQVRGQWVQVKQVSIPARPFLPIKHGAVDLPSDWQSSVLEAITQHIERGA